MGSLGASGGSGVGDSGEWQAGSGREGGERPREGRDGLEWAHVSRESGLSTKCQTK